MKKLIILIFLTQLSFSQTVNYDDIEIRPYLLNGKEIEKELKKAIVITDEIFEKVSEIKIEFVVSKDGEIISLETNTKNSNFNMELLSTFKKLGKWSSPEHSGKKVNCKISINVKIR